MEDKTQTPIKAPVVIAASILSLSVMIFSGVFLFRPEFDIEIIGHPQGVEEGFTVRTNRRTGERCLLNEGIVRLASNWEEFAKPFPVPLKLCEEAKKEKELLKKRNTKNILDQFVKP